jgi:iron complex outermembrane receptor protein
MKKITLFIALWAMSTFMLFAQNVTFEAILLEEETNEPLIGATVFFEETGQGNVSDIEGKVIIENVLAGEHEINISFLGFQTIDTVLNISSDNSSFTFYLHEANEDLEEIVVRATRSTRTIKNLPTRVEFIGLEELGEKAIMNSANISLVLRESTGIQIQQTSLSSGNSSIRIQGLDGRYTQLLKDGFPLFGGFSGGLSIMQIPPLDLQQFEIIKGSSSTLYGGGAIAGLVNMVSKTPEDEPNLEIMLTQTQALGSTANAFYSQRNGKIGYTLYGSGHYQNAYDPDGDDFTNLPETKSVSFNPKLFYYPNNNSQLWIGLNGTYDNRLGGDLTKINDGESGIHQFSERNISTRLSTQAVYENQMKEEGFLQIKNSVSYFDRDLSSPNLNFSGEQWNSFTEANYSFGNKKSDWIIGANIYSDDFEEKNSNNPRNQSTVTIGAFGNNTTDFSDNWVLESGFRTDYSPDWGVFALPRISLLWKATDRFSSRIGGGLGYKIPDIFTEEAAQLNFQNVLSIDKDNINAERSYGLNFDLNYRGTIADKITFSVNQLFYLTSIDNALLLNSLPNGNFQFENADGNVLSKGLETNLKFTYKDFRWFLNYAFINATLNYLPNNPQKPLTARHNAGSVLMYENEKWRIGYEAYYTGKQFLSDGTSTDDFIIMGLLIQKHFDWGSPFINFENFTDRRQARFSSEVSPPHESPIFNEIYAPTDGFIFSLGVVLKPFGNHHHEHH